MYRDAYAAARYRTLGRGPDSLDPALVRLGAARQALRVAGWVGLIAFAIMIVAVIALAVTGNMSSSRRSVALLSFAGLQSPTVWLLGSWPVMMSASLAIYLWRRLRSVAPLGSPGDALSEAVRGDIGARRRWQLATLASTEARSLALLVAAIALLAPLSLHLNYAKIFTINGEGMFHGLRSFDPYLAIALGGSWFSHIVVAVLAWHYADHARQKLRAGERPRPLISGVGHSAWAAAAAVVSMAPVSLASNIPYVVGVLVVAVIVFITGILFLPLTYWLGVTWLRHEEAVLVAARRDLGDVPEEEDAGSVSGEASHPG
ncbi:MAG: hypothetical protein KAI47_11595 [Deltaproteobacteria bacterium]|nr:hypothetical protein [Deltaproteobacteria bacterium]